jgi:hypothetical protein
MRSPADRRHWLERASRVGAVAALVALLFTPPVVDRRDLGVHRTRELPEALAAATGAPVASLSVTLDAVPPAAERAWLRALRAAGTGVVWQVRDSLPATVLAVEPIADPSRPRRITLAALPGGASTIRDDLGMLDSSRRDTTGSREVAGRTAGAITVQVDGATLRARAADSVVLRPVLLLGRAGWEARFTADALEEAGWMVEAEFVVTPPGAGSATGEGGSAVRTSGARALIDTARYAAVVVLDETAASRAPAIARFVASGGGLILGDGAERTLAALAPALPGGAFRELPGSLLSATPRRGLNGRALTALRPDAIVLERQGALPTVAARRHEMGRVLRIGYRDLWRWRMEGGESAPADHREWWSHAVASVAHAPIVEAPGQDVADDPAPLAALHAALGPPGAGGLDALATRPWALWLFALFLLLAMTEWTSRRLRGAP